MLHTIMGDIILLVNDEFFEYQYEALSCTVKNFHVDGRYKIICPVSRCPSGSVSIQCKILLENGKDTSVAAETGEDLFLVSFLDGINKLSIGTRGDIPGITYQHLQNGIKLMDKGNILPPCLIFYVAWKKIIDKEKDALATWFAADPTLS